ncbi:MAG: toprim domain-containing protein, partial [Acidobacteriota bacterium]
VPPADELTSWIGHPALRNAKELYPYRWPGGQLAAIEIKSVPATGGGRNPLWIGRPSSLGFVFGVTSGIYRWDAHRQAWRRPQESRPASGARYRRFERVDVPLYRAHIAEHENHSVFLCAGPKDAEAGALVGLSTVAQAGGEGRRLQRRARSLLASWGRDVKVIFDHDETGRQGAARAVEDLRNAGCAASVVDIESLAKKKARLHTVPKGFDLADLVEHLVDLAALAKESGMKQTPPFGIAELIAWRLWRGSFHQESLEE